MDAHNVTEDTFSQTSNTQRDNENKILTSENLDKSDGLVENLKELTIIYAGYYESDSANANDAKGYPASDPKIYNHTSDRKKRRVTDTSNGYLQQKLLSYRTLPIITMTMDHRIENRVATYGASLHKLLTTETTEVITDEVRSSARVIRTPRHVRQTDRDGTTTDNCRISISPPRDHSLILIGVIEVPPTIRHSGSLQVFNKRQYTVYDEIGDTQKLDTSVDRLVF